jgi:hypothetical protein
MENKNIIEHISNLLYPKMNEIMDNLEAKEINIFIHFITLELQESLKKWEQWK